MPTPDRPSDLKSPIVGVGGGGGIQNQNQNQNQDQNATQSQGNHHQTPRYASYNRSDSSGVSRLAQAQVQGQGQGQGYMREQTHTQAQTSIGGSVGSGQGLGMGMNSLTNATTATSAESKAQEHEASKKKEVQESHSGGGGASTTTTGGSQSSDAVKKVKLGAARTIPGVGSEVEKTQTSSTHLFPIPASLSELVDSSLDPFDVEKNVVGPVEEMGDTEEKFREELMTEFLRFMIKFHAWSSARPRIELDKAEGELEGRVRVLRGVEEEQAQTRKKLEQFVVQFRNALAVLTGVGF